MATQSGATVTVSLSAPVTAATLPTAASYESQRLTDRNGPSLEVGELTSNEVSENRQETSIRSGFQQVSGQLGFEFSHLAQDRLIELATTETFTANDTGTGFAVTDGSGKYTITSPLSAKVGLVDVFSVGSHVFVGRIGTTSSAGDTLFAMVNISGQGFTAGTATQQASTTISRVRKGDMLYSAICKSYPEAGAGGAGLFQTFTGCTVNNLAFSMQPGSLVTGTADILGLSAGDMTLAGSVSVDVEVADTYDYVTATDVLSIDGPDFSAFSAGDGVTFSFEEAGGARSGSGVVVTATASTIDIAVEAWTSTEPGNVAGVAVSVAGTVDLAAIPAASNPGASSTAYSPFASCAGLNDGPNAVVSGIDFTINNNRETVPLLCTAFADSVYEGVANVSGTVTLLFEDEVEYNKFASETETTLTVGLKATAGSGADMMIFHFPRVRYTQPSFEVPANGPVVLTLNFRALESTYSDGVKTSCVILKTA